MEQISYKLEVFEGPLDLLLHLIDKEKVSIYDIPIADILTQYLVYIERYKQEDIDNLSEFIMMASQLVYIKSKMLLPKEEEEEGDPRDELAMMLAEYKKCKEAAQFLKQNKLKFGDTVFVKKPDVIEKDKTYGFTHLADELVQAYNGMFKKNMRRLPPPASSFDGIVRTAVVSVTSKVLSILRRLIREKTISFRVLMASQGSRSDVIAAFLAVLELSKVNRIFLKEVGDADYKITLSKGGGDHGNEKTRGRH